MWFPSLGREDPLEEGMATHSSILAWEFPRTEEPGGLQSTGSQRVRQDWARTHTPTVGLLLVSRPLTLMFSQEHTFTLLNKSLAAENCSMPLWILSLERTRTEETTVLPVIAGLSWSARTGLPGHCQLKTPPVCDLPSLDQLPCGPNCRMTHLKMLWAYRKTVWVRISLARKWTAGLVSPELEGLQFHYESITQLCMTKESTWQDTIESFPGNFGKTQLDVTEHNFFFFNF